MAFPSYVYIFFIILLIISENQSASSNKNNSNVHVLAKKKFGEVLDVIANVNEKKLNALKRYNELDKNPIGTGVLRFIDDGDEPLVAILLLKNDNPESLIGVMHQANENNKKTHIISNLSHMPQLLKDYYEYDTETSSEMKFDKNEDLNDGNESELLRLDERELEKGINDSKHNTEFVIRNILRGSSKKTYKKCKKACARAYKNVCGDYRCSSSFKKEMKKECKYECKYYFEYY